METPEIAKPPRALALALEQCPTESFDTCRGVRAAHMPRLGSKKSRHGCVQCKTRRVKVRDISQENFWCYVYHFSAMRTGHAARVLDIASSVVC
jgi:hypothetical protein